MSTTPDPVSVPARASASPGASGGIRIALRVALVIIAAGAASLAVIRCTTRRDAVPAVPAAASSGCAGGARGQRDCLPDLAYVDTTGAAYSRAQLIGKVVLVNFWATWCQPCEREIPDLSKAYQKYRNKGVVFLGILIDNPDSQQLLNFQSDHDMTYPVVRANLDLLASYENPQAYPTTYIYDRAGKRVYNHLGQVKESELDSLLATLSAQN